MKNTEMKFVLDVMLGRLARWLRLLGCDVYYDNRGEDSGLLGIALAEGRILLTRDRELARRAGISGRLIRAGDTEGQLREVVKRFGITPTIYGDRCPECNGSIVEVDKDSVEGEVPKYTFLTHKKFRRCGDCGRIFWEGSHRELAENDLRKILGDTVESK